MTLVGAADVALQWYPIAFRQPEWEFGTVAVTLGSLPLLTLGLAALQASFAERGARVALVVLATVFALIALLIGASYLLFLLDAPVVLKNAPGPAEMAIKKSIIRTTIMGLGFGAAYATAAVVSFRYVSRMSRHA
jgi:hypothetical protein